MVCSWKSLGPRVYQNVSLKNKIESYEKSFNSKDEVDVFKKLVNTSISRKQPYHKWIRYREGYSGELVKEILTRYPVGENQTVFDPMCGSGSTVVACNELGISSIGTDVNPYAILSTSMKSLNWSQSFRNQINEQLLKVLAHKNNNNKNSINKNDFETGIAKYFDTFNFQELIKIKRSIFSACDEKTHKDFLFFALLAIVEDCSNRKKDGNGLATRPSKVSNVSTEFTRQVELMLSDYETHPYPNIPRTSLKLLSALEINGREFGRLSRGKAIGSIIFSPPYANSFDYFESYKMELVFGEWTKIEDLKSKRKALIRNYRLGYGKELSSDIELVEDLCSELWRKIPEKELETGVRDGRTRLVPNMLRAYFEDMRKVILDGMNKLVDGGYMHIIVDQSSYIGVPIPTDIIFAHIAEINGYEVVEMIKCRNANTSGQQMKKFPYLKGLLRESIVVIRKK